jgi:hypothetical protein
MGLGDPDQNVVNRAVDHLSTLMPIVETHLGNSRYFLGDTLFVADFLFDGSMANWHICKMPLEGAQTALPNASLHVHQPLGGFQGQASDILIQAEETQKTKQRLTRLYGEHCGRSYAEVEATLDRDCFMTAEEALTWGLTDRILGKSEVTV